MGNVYWITGLSGAGKTTIGKLFYKELKKNNNSIVFLDGDELREVFGNDLGYSKEDRYKSAMRNARLCKMLSSQNIDVICCTISMFDSVREWNRNNITNYNEIYIKVSKETLYNRNQKNLYTNANEDVAGIHFNIEEPKSPDIILNNNNNKTPEQQLQILLDWYKNIKLRSYNL